MTYCSDKGLSSPYWARKASRRSLPNCGAALPAINLIGSPGTRRGKKKLIEIARKNVSRNSNARRLKLVIDSVFPQSMFSSDCTQCQTEKTSACVGRSLLERGGAQRGLQLR